jgi:hypothetical protein
LVLVEVLARERNHYMELTLTREQREVLDATTAVEDDQQDGLDDIYDFGAWLALDEQEDA